MTDKSLDPQNLFRAQSCPDMNDLSEGELNPYISNKSLRIISPNSNTQSFIPWNTGKKDSLTNELAAMVSNESLQVNTEDASSLKSMLLSAYKNIQHQNEIIGLQEKRIVELERLLLGKLPPSIDRYDSSTGSCML